MAKRSAIIGLACLLACLPACGSPPPAAPEPARPQVSKETPVPEYFLYYMQKGDTLYSLGQRFHVPWDEIARADGSRRPDGLPVGTLLMVPRVPGVEVPELQQPAAAPERASAARVDLRPEDLQKRKPSSAYWWPTRGRVVRRYGETLRGLPEHGIGIAAPAGTEVCAVAAGTVIACVHAVPARPSAWGNVVAVSHAGGDVSWYANLGEIDVEKGARVSKGEPIGTVGSSGAAEEELAFRLYRNDHQVDPEDYLP
jgi:murein DD-endopeptidase MepM/ murein hydrolase activator NlpD